MQAQTSACAAKLTSLGVNSVHSSIPRVWTTVAALAAMAGVAGCANSHGRLKLEPAAVARQLGVPRCRASVPLTQEEVLGDARRWGDPHPESRPEWLKIIAEIRPGDQLRMIDCIRTHHNFYYAHIRNGAIVTEMYTIILDRAERVTPSTSLERKHDE